MKESKIKAANSGIILYIKLYSRYFGLSFQTLLVPKVVSKMQLEEIVNTNATITCQNPVPDLYTFIGNLEINDGNRVTSGHLTIDNLLLRGSRLKDTDHIVGCAVYTGQDTKLSLNSKTVSNKFSSVEK